MGTEATNEPLSASGQHLKYDRLLIEVCDVRAFRQHIKGDFWCTAYVWMGALLGIGCQQFGSMGATRWQKGAAPARRTTGAATRQSRPTDTATTGAGAGHNLDQPSRSTSRAPAQLIAAVVYLSSS
jgi:hypothetical protein